MTGLIISFLVGSIGGAFMGGFVMLFAIAAGMARREKENGRQTDESS